MAASPPPRDARDVTEPLIEREELEGLLFNVADMAYVLGEFHGLVFPETEQGDESDEG